jgi:hypothetical protein
MHKIEMQMISIFLEKNHVSFYANTYSLRGFDEKINHITGLEGKGFFKPFG